METRYEILGMTCDHCARAVRDELTRLEGVSDVAVDVAAGDAVVTSSGPLADDAVRVAVREAGYELAHPGALPLR